MIRFESFPFSYINSFYRGTNPNTALDNLVFSIVDLLMHCRSLRVNWLKVKIVTKCDLYLYGCGRNYTYKHPWQILEKKTTYWNPVPPFEIQII